MLRALVIGLSVVTCAQAASAAIIVASQDHSVRRGPTVENGIHIKQSTNNSTDRYGMFRFDSSLFGPGVTSVTFMLTANSDTVVQFQGTYDYRIFGVPDGTANDEVFIEGSVNYDPGAGVVYDGSADLVDDTKLTQLGDANSVSAGDTISLSNAALLSFIQADTNDVATLVVIRLTTGGNSTFLDRTTGSPPRLDIIPEPTTLALVAVGLLGLRRRRR